jgi:hypothetical protein
MSTPNSIWIGPGSKPGIRDGNLATNILSTAGYLVTVTTVPKIPAVTSAALWSLLPTSPVSLGCYGYLNAP